MTYEEKKMMVKETIANWCDERNVVVTFYTNTFTGNDYYEFKHQDGDGGFKYACEICSRNIDDNCSSVIVHIIGNLCERIAEYKYKKEPKYTLNLDYAYRDDLNTHYVCKALRTAYNKYGDDIKDVIFNDPATIVFWKDGTKTVVKCQEGEKYDREKGLAMAIAKKKIGSNHRDYYEVFAKYIGRDDRRKSKKNPSPFVKAFNQIREVCSGHDITKEG